MPKNISSEQFSFLGCQGSTAQFKVLEAKRNGNKIDLSKEFNWARWSYIRILLTHLGFKVPFIIWIMSCLSLVSLIVLIYGSTPNFFQVQRGLRQGCPLSPLLFWLVVEGLGRKLREAKRKGGLHGACVEKNLSVTHMLSVNDVLIISDGPIQDVTIIKEVLNFFDKSTRMMVNIHKSSLSLFGLSRYELTQAHILFPFQSLDSEARLKYLGFYLKPNDYKINEWMWLIAKVEKIIKAWCFRWFYRFRRLVLIKSVLEVISIFWISLSLIPLGVLKSIQTLCSIFLWMGIYKDIHFFTLVRWDRISLPKGWGGWGIKSIHSFSKALDSKVGWRLFFTEILWNFDA